MELSEKLRDNFDEMVVYKDLKKTNFFSTLSLPAFMRDWLLKKFEDDEGEFDKDDLTRFVKKFIPKIHVKRLCFRNCCVIMLVSVF